MSILVDTYAAVTRVHKRLAVLACLAWALLPLRTSLAERVFEPLDHEAVIATDTDSDESFGSTLCEPFAQDDSVVATSAVASDNSSVAPPGRWDRQCRCFPQGSIPYIGPRTPDDQKHRGMGLPLVGRGWRSQPFAISAFSGATDGDALIRHRVHQQPSFYGGVNFSWDYDHYWGIEKRLGFGALNVADGNYKSIADTGLSVTGEYRLMYYPLGDARWRPFITAGVGWSDFYYEDDIGKTHLDTVGMIPFGGGLKYLWTERIAFRIDLIDEFTFGTGALSDFHYVALTAGVEFRYGHRLLKMPWHRDAKHDAN